MKPTARRRSFFSFGLRELLIFMLVISLLSIRVGRRLQRDRQQRAALTKIEAAGWQVTFDNGNYEPDQPNWSDLLFGPSVLNDVDKALYVSNSEEEEISLASMAQLKNLEWLWVSGPQVSDLAPIAELNNLRVLSVSGRQVSDLSPLVQLKNLEELRVSDTQVSELAPLAHLKNLKELFVFNTQVSDLSPLAQLTNLEQLDVSNTQVSDLSPLAQLKNLKWLYVYGTRVSDQQVRQLQDALPNCAIDGP